MGQFPYLSVDLEPFKCSESCITAFAVKLHTNGRYTCGSNVAVDEDRISYAKDHKIRGKNPGIVRILEPMDSSLNYFEYKIISGGMQCAVSIGMGGADYPLDRIPGCSLNGIGYHANDGKCFCECGTGKDFGPTCTVGDRMGCGIDFRSQDSSRQVHVFFTKNGQQVGDVVKIKIPAGGLYPLIGLSSEGEQVQYLGHWHLLPLTLKGPLIACIYVYCDSERNEALKHTIIVCSNLRPTSTYVIKFMILVVSSACFSPQ